MSCGLFTIDWSLAFSVSFIPFRISLGFDFKGNSIPFPNEFVIFYPFLFPDDISGYDVFVHYPSIRNVQETSTSIRWLSAFLPSTLQPRARNFVIVVFSHICDCNKLSYTALSASRYLASDRRVDDKMLEARRHGTLGETLTINVITWFENNVKTGKLNNSISHRSLNVKPFNSILFLLFLFFCRFLSQLVEENI